MIRRVLVVSFVALAGCRGELWYPPDAQKVPESREKFLLSYTRKPGQLDRYRASFKLKRTGSAWMEEEVEQVIYDETVSRDEEGRFQVAFRRRDLTRTARRQGRKGQIVEDVPLDRDPEITPNFFVERGTPRNYYVISPRGLFAMRKRHDPLNPEEERFQYPFHYVAGESLAFLLPVLPEKGKKLGVGGRWTVELPVIVGRSYGRNDFALEVEHTVESVVELGGGRKCVVIDFKFKGLFDSGDEKFAKRFTDAERTRRKSRCEVTGQGKVYFDPVLGKALWKTLDYTVASRYGRKVLLPRGEKTGETMKVDVTETTFSFASRLMARGERVTRPRETRAGP